MCVERVEAGRQSGVMTSEGGELWGLRRGNRLLAHEHGVFRKAGVYLSYANLRGKLMYPLVADHLGQQLMEHVREELWCRNEKKPDPCGSPRDLQFHPQRPEPALAPSDRGSQFRSRKLLPALAHHCLIRSMSPIASYDTTTMENLLNLLKKNIPHHHEPNPDPHGPNQTRRQSVQQTYLLLLLLLLLVWLLGKFCVLVASLGVYWSWGHSFPACSRGSENTLGEGSGVSGKERAAEGC